MKRPAVAFFFALATWTNLLQARPLVVCDDVADPPSLDPLRIFSEKSHTIIYQIFDGLVVFGPEGDVEPALAVSWKRIDSLTIRFHLRSDVQFHNGEVFNADAVRFSVERHLDPAYPGLGFISTIKEVRVLDPHTVDIITHVPDSLLLRRLAGFLVMVPPKAYSTDKDFGSRPVGTGPFRFTDWTRGERLELKLNKGHWKVNPGSPDGLVFRFLPAEEQLALLLKGELDIVTELPGTATLRVSQNSNTKVVKKETLYTICGTPNTSRGPLKDVRVRRAINHAINKRELVRYDLLGNGRIIASSMPGEVGHEPSLTPYEYNPEKAKALLKEAGAPVPLRIKTLVKVQAVRAARIIAKQLEAVGIELDIYALTTDADTIRDMASKDMDLGISAIPNPMAHVCFIPSVMLYSKSPFSLQKDPEFDKRLEAVVAEVDPIKHEALARTLDKYVHAQALGLFTYQRIRTYGVSKRTRFVPYLTGMPRYIMTKVEPDNSSKLPSKTEKIP